MARIKRSIMSCCSALSNGVKVDKGSGSLNPKPDAFIESTVHERGLQQDPELKGEDRNPSSVKGDASCYADSKSSSQILRPKRPIIGGGMIISHCTSIECVDQLNGAVLWIDFTYRSNHRLSGNVGGIPTRSKRDREYGPQKSR